MQSHSYFIHPDARARWQMLARHARRWADQNVRDDKLRPPTSDNLSEHVAQKPPSQTDAAGER